MDEVKDYPPYLDYPKPHKAKTNADRIRSMTNEELAVWMTSIRLDILNELCKKLDVKIEMPVPTVKNTAEVREWLQQPAEKQKEDD